MRHLPIFAALLLAAACAGEKPAEPVANEAAPAETAPKAEVPSLEGSWQVTMVDGAEARPLGMTATLGGGKASIDAGCFRRAWTYSQKGNMVEFRPSPGGSANCGGQTPNVQQETAYAALDGVNIAIFSLKGQRADLSGTGGSLTLERR